MRAQLPRRYASDVGRGGGESNSRPDPLLRSLLGVGLEVLVGGESQRAAEQEHSVEANAEAGRVGSLVRRGRSRLRLGLRVTGLQRNDTVSSF